MAKNLSIFSILALAMIAAGTGSYGATVYQAEYNTLDLDDHPMIVTNVTFEGLVTLVDITNIVDSISTNFVPALRKEIADASEAGTNYVDSATNDVLSAAQGYTDEKISDIPPPDFSTNNTALVETIEATAPPPGDYAAVSNAAVFAAITNALQDAAITNLRESVKLETEPIPDSKWVFSPADYNGTPIDMGITENAGVYSLTPMVGGQAAGFSKPYAGETNAVVWRGTSGGGSPEWVGSENLVATRLPRYYVLGDQADKPLASEAEAEALRTNKADKISNPTDNNFVAMDASGNLKNSGRKPSDFVLKNAAPVTIGYGVAAGTADSIVAIGQAAKANAANATSIGHNAEANGLRTVAIGSSDVMAERTAALANYSVAIGGNAVANATSAVQIGSGTNSVAKSLKFRNTTVVDSDGKIPASSLDTRFATTGEVAEAISAYVDSATNDILVAAQGYTDEKISEIPPPANYANVSNAAMNAASRVDPTITNGIRLAGYNKAYWNLSGNQTGWYFTDSNSNAYRIELNSDSNFTSNYVGNASDVLLASRKWVDDRLASKANDADVVHTTGNEEIAGKKTFYGGIGIANGADIDFYNGGRVIIRTTSGSVAILNHDGIDYSTDDGFNYEHYDWPSASGNIALTAGAGHTGNLAALDAAGNPTDSGLSKTNVVTFTYDVNSNRTAVTVGVPRHNDPNFEAETPELDAVGEFFTVPALVGPHSLAITGDDESDPYRGTVASGTGSIAANKSVATNRFSVALGYTTFAAGEAAVSHGRETSALGGYSHSEGQHARAVGLFSHAEGESTEARGWGSHAEGVYAEADGRYAHAEGNNTLAEGDYSHAEGASTYASGLYSHAEGNQSHAVGHSAHSDGINAHATNATSYVWQGASTEDSGGVPYKPGAYYSHGVGTYNINPNGGLAGFWVGETNLEQHVANLTAGKANRASPATEGNLAALNAAGNPTDSGLSKDDVESLFFSQYYPDGSVKSAAEFTEGIKYDDPDTTNRTITVRPFCNTGDSESDNSNLSERVVIPPFVDAQGNGYISDDGTRYKVVEVTSDSGFSTDENTNLTAIIAPNTVTNIGNYAFASCPSLTSVSLPAVTSIGNYAFDSCTSLTSVSLPTATSIGFAAFNYCPSLTSVSLPAVTSIGNYAFANDDSLTSVDFGATLSSIPSLGVNAFSGVPMTCKIVVPYTQYDEWKAADGWRDLPQKFVRHAEKADKPATFTTGNLAEFDANGNPADSGLSAEPLLFAQYYPDGSVKSAAEFTEGIKYGTPDTTNRTITVRPFCDTVRSANNSGLVGRVVIPPFVDVGGYGYISDNGKRYKVVGVSGGIPRVINTNLTAIIAPSTVATIGEGAFPSCTSLSSVLLPAATTIGASAFDSCTSLSSVSLPAATSVGDYAFAGCTSLASVSFPAATTIGEDAFYYCTSLASVDFGDTPRPSVPTLGTDAFDDVPTSCKIIVPDSQYAAWTAAKLPDGTTDNPWYALVTAGYKFLRHSEWEYARKYELDPLLFAQYYPEGNVKSAAEFTAGIKYDAPDTTTRTITVKPFCNTGTATNDNSSLAGHVVIPPFVDAQGHPFVSDDGTKYKVVGVGSGTDSNNSNENLTAVIAPSTVANIEDRAFRRCTRLASVSIPAATSIGSGAFNTCTSLASVSLPAVASIGTYAFNSCTKLASVSIPAVTNIQNYAFYSCNKLTSVSIPAAKSISGHVFDGCTKLASVSLPAATSVGGSAFNNCNSLASVSLPVVTSIDGYSFAGCTSLTSVDFGETLSSAPRLGSNAFSSVPTSCKIIVPDAQYDAWTVASGWRDLYNNGNGYKFLKHSEWEYARKYEVESLFFSQYYPDGSVKGAAEFTQGIKYDAPDTTNRTITVRPFCNTGIETNDNSSLVGRVVVPPFVDARGNGYISDDDTRYKVVGVSDGSLAYDNTNLTAIVAPNTVTTIGELAFPICSSLTSVSLPSAQTVGGGAFGICSSLTSVYLPVAVTISKEAFYSCTSLTSISLPSAQTVGESAFYSCTSLTSISLPSAQTVGESAFQGCTSLTSVSLPVAASIGESAFNGCEALVSVSLPAATSIWDIAFGGCAALASVSLPATTNIGDGAFGICSSLTSISLPSAQTVGESAFSYCTSLTSVDFGATPRPSVPSLGADAFTDVTNTCTIIVPYTQYDAWIAADGWKDLTQEFVRHAEKADKPATFTTGNLAKFDANGNPTDSGKKAGDFATAAQGTKADTAIQGVKVNGTALTPDANKAVNVQVPVAGSALPLIAGESGAGSSSNFSREDHVHPAETAVLPTGYALPASAFPVSYYGQSTSDPADIMLFEATAGSGDVPFLPPSYGEVIAMRLSWRDPTEYAAAAFNKSSGAFIRGDGALYFNGNSGVEGVSPVLTARDSTVIVRGVEVASRVANATAGNLAALDANGNPTDSTIPAANVVVAPDYNNTNNHFYATASDATSALYRFGNVGTNTWTTTRSGIGYLRMVGPQSNGPTVRLYVNEVDDAHRLFVWGSPGRDIIVPVFLRAGDSLKLHVDGSQPLSDVQLSMFYTD